MANRYKTTGCARFFFFLIIFVPVVYFGARFLDDTGQMEGIREKLEDFGRKNSNESKQGQNEPETNEFDLDQVKRQLAGLIAKVESQERIIQEQEEIIQNQKERIEVLMHGDPIKVVESTSASSEITKNKKADDKPSLEELLKEADKVVKKNEE